jgi:23S rRNA pseudouridine1911/1915/1917 synthase
MTDAPTRVRFVVAPQDRGLRLDQLLAARVEALSRRQARVLLDIGGVFVDGARVKVASRQLRPGQVVEATLGGALARARKQVGRAARARDARDLPAYRIVHQDDDIVVVDKPAGLLTAPTPESDRNNLAQLLEAQLGAPIYVVHRIDLQTSGLLVFARTSYANRALSARFRDHDVTREYIAVVAGRVAPTEQTVRLPVAGRPAVTHFRVDQALGAVATVLRCRLETGRTHQIRIHCQHLGHPVLADPHYGQRTACDPPRMALHAAVLGFAHPATAEPLLFACDLPGELASWLDAVRDSAARG